MAAELWCRISSAAPGNAVRWATEISWISTRGFTGVRVGIGFSDTDPDGIAYDPSGINLTHLNTILDMLVMCKLKCQLEIGGEGPPNIYDWYNGVGGYGSAWPYGKRPPLGPGNAIVDLTALFKSQAIALMFDKYRRAGLDPYEYCKVEIWNEPARGGAGAEVYSSGYWGSTPVSPMGTWDSLANIPNPAPTTPYATVIDYLNNELPQIDFMDLPLVSPTLTSRMLDQETNSLEQELLTCLAPGDDWLAVFNASSRPTWGINCYYSLEGSAISLGPELFAQRAVHGRDLRVAGTEDINAIVYRIAAMRDALPNGRRIGITICEAGIMPVQVSMTTGYDRTRRLNYEELGRYRLAYLDALRELDVESVVFYTASDTDSTDLEDRYGTFNDDIGTGNDQTYSADIPFARRAGLSALVPFAGDDYVMATGEVLPPGIS